MKLLVLTGGGPEHVYVANRLSRSLAIEAIIVDDAIRNPSLRRAFRGGAVRGLSRIGLHLYRKAIGDWSAREASLRNVLGEELTADYERQELVTRVDAVNGHAALSKVEEVGPDALIVFGTTIIGPAMLGLPKEIAFNLHTGISPRYRGTDCAFWPVVKREPEWLGATVHECTADVDGGQIFGTTTTAWETDDGIHELFARTVIAGCDLYVDVLKRYVAGENLAGQRQDLTVGNEYRGFMRTLGPELSARWALRRGLLRRSPRRDV